MFSVMAVVALKMDLDLFDDQRVELKREDWNVSDMLHQMKIWECANDDEMSEHNRRTKNG